MNPFDPGYYTDAELKTFGFKSIGSNVQIAKNCTIIGLENIEIGSHVRIDGYCTLLAAGQGFLKLGSFIHIGGYCMLAAGEGICMEDFTGLSHGVRIYSRSDDYSGQYLTNPTVPPRYTNITRGMVTLERHVIAGSGATILPGVTVGIGSSVGAHALVTKSLDPWGIYSGVPARKVNTRSDDLLALEAALRKEIGNQETPSSGNGATLGSA